MAFKYKRSVGGDYARQGYIYFTSLRFRELGERRQERIRTLCHEVGGEYASALFEFVTTETTATAVCLKHCLSRSQLYRIVGEYYRNFPKGL